jgi:hypothetical protein
MDKVKANMIQQEREKQIADCQVIQLAAGRRMANALIKGDRQAATQEYNYILRTAATIQRLVDQMYGEIVRCGSYVVREERHE